jgi:hypothetical protein
MYKERLLKLADFLGQVPVEQFDLARWRCDSSACAVGWACTMPAFIAEGLKIAHDGLGWFPAFKGRGGWEAVDFFFELNPYDSEYLFDEGCYDGETKASPAEVADRIRKFIESGGKRDACN